MDSLSKEIILSSIQHLENPQIISSSEDLNSDILSQVPELWLELISLDKIDFSKLKKLWNPVLEKVPKLMSNLETKLKGIAILTEENFSPSLLYIFTQGRDLYYHRGFLPLNTEIPSTMITIWSKLPSQFRQLYSIHNGWVSLNAMSMGHLPIEKCFILAEEEWSLDYKTLEKYSIELDHTVAVFSNGGGGYLCFNLSNLKCPDVSKSIIWWSDEPSKPDININFWEIFDMWTSIYFEDLDLRQSNY